MRFAIDIPNFGPSGDGDFGDPLFVAELAHEAEEAGWDGFFVWDHLGADWPIAIADPIVLLTAIAMRTSTLKLGPMVTPLPRRRPWKLARELVTLDHVSQGRVIFGAGIGGGEEYSFFHEPGDDRAHGEMLDEGLAIVRQLWSGEPCSHHGTHYHIDSAQFLPRPVQSHIPIWIAGQWPNPRPMRRAARWHGVFPIARGRSFTEQMTAEEMGAVAAFVNEHRVDTSAPYDLVHWGITTGDQDTDRRTVEPYAAVGVTWWLENLNVDRGTIAEQRERIRRGPPRLG